MPIRSPFTLALACTLAAQTNAGHPKALKLASGKVVQVLKIKKSTMQKTDEPCLVLYYVTNIPFSDMESLYNEVEEVWSVFRPLAEKEGVRAAVVNANEPASAALQMTKGAGWAWKRGRNGKWHAPVEGDEGLVPK